MNTYALFRKIHLYSGLILLTFIVMYFTTGYAIVHHRWFPKAEPVITIRTEALPFADVGDPAAYSQVLAQRFDFRGRRQKPIALDDGRWRFRYVRPGILQEALVAADGRTAVVTIRNETLHDTIAGLHDLHGYGGGWLYDVWAAVCDLAALSMIVFALTGIYLWYRLTQRRLVGWILLGVSYGYAGVTILYLMYAP